VVRVGGIPRVILVTPVRRCAGVTWSNPCADHVTIRGCGRRGRPCRPVRIADIRDSCMPSALICGSLAYDTIMVFEDQFKNHILPDKVHILNVSFLVPHMRREFGGCAGNIAYNLKLLGGEPIPMATVGQDFGPYREWFMEQGIPLDHVRELPDTFTAQAFMTTDLDNNQITAFHPGAMLRSFENHVRDVPDVAFGIVAPDGREAMLQNAEEFAERGIPFIFDPGQAMPLFNREEFRAFVDKADYVTVNDYESSLLQHRTGWSEDEITRRVKAYIVTRGPNGSLIHTSEGHHEIPPAHEHSVIDPTGCGDAYRAGLIHGIMQGQDWPTIGRMASLMGALKVEHPGTQNQRFDWDRFATRFREEFGYAPG
jgi:adenosine kinase